MSEKRILIVDSEVLQKIDENRGEMSRSDFISLVIDSQFKESAEVKDCVSKEEFNQFAQGMREVLRNFLEFFISYGVELGQPPRDKAFEELSKKLQSLDRAKK